MTEMRLSILIVMLVVFCEPGFSQDNPTPDTNAAVDTPPATTKEAISQRQYRTAWNGLIYASTNQRYHLKRARILEEELSGNPDPDPPLLDRPYIRGSLFAITVLGFTLGLYMQSIKKTSVLHTKVRPLLYGLGVAGLCIPQFLSPSAQQVQNQVRREIAISDRANDVRTHQFTAAQWARLSEEWERAVMHLYYEQTPLPEEQLIVLRKQQTSIDASEQDTKDSTLHRECKQEAEAYALGTFGPRNQAAGRDRSLR